MLSFAPVLVPRHRKLKSFLGRSLFQCPVTGLPPPGFSVQRTFVRDCIFVTVIKRKYTNFLNYKPSHTLVHHRQFHPTCYVFTCLHSYRAKDFYEETQSWPVPGVKQRRVTLAYSKTQKSPLVTVFEKAGVFQRSFRRVWAKCSPPFLTNKNTTTIKFLEQNKSQWQTTHANSPLLSTAV